MFESTIIIYRPDLFAWASSGTLTGELATPSGDAFDWEVVSRRDRQLARRDIVLSNSVADVAATISTVWGMNVPYSAPPEPDVIDMPGDMPGLTNSVGTLGHVANSSTPNAYLLADEDLLKRDLIILEGLRQLSAYVPDAVISGTLPGPIGLNEAWSLAEGTLGSLSINAIQPLNTDSIKGPDSALAANDNLVASNLAFLRQILRNPLLTATRLVIKSADNTHEAESYVLSEDTSDRRVWKSEPGLEGRMTVTYDKTNQSVAWTDESGDIPLSYPQPFSSEVPGTISGDIEILPFLEDRKDSEFWRKKARQIKSAKVGELKLFSVDDVGRVASGHVYESRGKAILTEPGTTLINMSSESIPAGLTRIAVLLTPESEIIVDGSKGLGGSSTDDVYTDFPQAGGSVTWHVKVPIGDWAMAIYFTNILGDPAETWPFLVQLNESVVSNLGLRVTEDNGTYQHSDYFVTSTTNESVPLVLTWSPNDSSNQLRVHSIVFTRTSTSQVYVLEARLGSAVSGSIGGSIYGPETVELDSLPLRPDSATFIVSVENDIADPCLELSWIPIGGSIGLTPLAISRVDAMSVIFNDVTKNSDGFDGWPGEMADRAVESVVESFNRGSKIDPTFEPGELVEGLRYWTPSSTKKWLGLIKTAEPRFDSAFRTGGPGDVGRPAIMPNGIQFDLESDYLDRYATLEAEVVGTLGSARVVTKVAGSLCHPQLAAFQPWMSSINLPVLREDFWSETSVIVKLTSITGYSNPAQGGVVSGGGSYPYGDFATLTATPSPTWSFTGWYTPTGSLFSVSSTLTFKVTESTVLEARFTL